MTYPDAFLEDIVSPLKKNDSLQMDYSLATSCAFNDWLKEHGEEILSAILSRFDDLVALTLMKHLEIRLSVERDNRLGGFPIRRGDLVGVYFYYKGNLIKRTEAPLS